MEIREAREPDLVAMSALMKATQDAHVEAYAHRYSPMSLAAVEAFLRAELDSKAQFFVAVENGVVLGYSAFEFLEAPESPVLRSRRYAYLRQIGVSTVAMGRGIGAALVDHLRGVCRAEGVDEIELDVWAFNDRALRFFSKAGFEVFATKMRAPASSGTKTGSSG